MASISTTSFRSERLAKGGFWLGAIAVATMSALGCHVGARSGDDGARALQQRHVDAERLGVLMSTTPTLASAMGKIADPWTRILTAPEAQALSDDLNYKTAAGIGLPELLSIDLDVRGYTVQIVDPLPGSPADRAGLKTGDTVVIDRRASHRTESSGRTSSPRCAYPKVGRSRSKYAIAKKASIASR